MPKQQQHLANSIEDLQWLEYYAVTFWTTTKLIHCTTKYIRLERFVYPRDQLYASTVLMLSNLIRISQEKKNLYNLIAWTAPVQGEGNLRKEAGSMGKKR